MGLRFFADHCVPRSVARLLSEAGHEVLLLNDHLPNDSPDSAVISKARDLNSILISLNGDFFDIVTYPPSAYDGIIALQIRNHPQSIKQIVNRLIIYLS